MRRLILAVFILCVIGSSVVVVDYGNHKVVSVAAKPQEVKSHTEIFKITHYCDCFVCCGKTDGITKTGTKATVNRTIAVDPEVIPLGSRVEIDGIIYIAEDIGGAIKGNRLDIFCGTHKEALQRGVIMREVKIYD